MRGLIYLPQVQLLIHLLSLTVMLIGIDTTSSESQYSIIPLKIYYNSVIKYRLRSRGMKNINISTNTDIQVAAGRRSCTEEETRSLKCMSGECESLVTSSIHIFLHCKCPSDSRGPRCEEAKIDSSQMGNISIALSKIGTSPLCQGVVNILEHKAILYDFDIVKHCVLSHKTKDLRRFLRKNVLNTREKKLVRRQLARIDKKKRRKRLQKKKSKGRSPSRARSHSRDRSQSRQLDMLDSALGNGKGVWEQEKS